MNNLIIVIIDDEPRAREGLKAYINRLFPESRFEFHLCNSVKEGVSVIETYLPDLVFLDIEMPEANGFELFHQVNQNSFRSEEHTSELQSRPHLVCRLLLEKKKNKQ